MSQDIGKVGMCPQGMYERTRAYERLDVVTYQGSSWVAIVDVPAQISPAMGSDYWQLVARIGETGPQGPVGPQGNSAFDGTGVELVNNLTQGGQTAALSAEQGKILKQELTELESIVVNASIDITSGKIIEAKGRVVVNRKFPISSEPVFELNSGEHIFKRYYGSNGAYLSSSYSADAAYVMIGFIIDDSGKTIVTQDMIRSYILTFNGISYELTQSLPLANVGNIMADVEAIEKEVESNRHSIQSIAEGIEDGTVAEEQELTSLYGYGYTKSVDIPFVGERYISIESDNFDFSNSLEIEERTASGVVLGHITYKGKGYYKFRENTSKYLLSFDSANVVYTFNVRWFNSDSLVGRLADIEESTPAIDGDVVKNTAFFKATDKVQNHIAIQGRFSNLYGDVLDAISAPVCDASYFQVLTGGENLWNGLYLVKNKLGDNNAVIGLFPERNLFIGDTTEINEAVYQSMKNNYEDILRKTDGTTIITSSAYGNYTYECDKFVIGNELDIAETRELYGMQTKEQAFHYYRIAYEIIKAYRPNVNVSNFALAFDGSDDTFLNEMFEYEFLINGEIHKIWEYCDTFDLHYYQAQSAAESIIPRLTILRQKMLRYDYVSHGVDLLSKPITIGEFGSINGKNADGTSDYSLVYEQASSLVRKAIILLSMGAERIAQYAFYQQSDGYRKWDLAKLTRDTDWVLTSELELLPAYNSLLTLKNMMPSGSTRPSLTFCDKDGICAASWIKPNGTKVLALWGTSKNNVNVKLKYDTLCTIKDINGEDLYLTDNLVVNNERVFYFIDYIGLKIFVA